MYKNIYINKKKYKYINTNIYKIKQNYKTQDEHRFAGCEDAREIWRVH